MNKYLFSLLAMFISLSTLAQTIGTLSVTATTSQTTSPSYQQKNIVAFWIEDSNGSFVKTLLAYASERRQYLVAWRTKTNIAGSVYNTTDAITAATQTSHGARSASWNGKNRSQVLVADGTYTLKMEVTDNNGTVQNLAAINFVKGPSNQTLTPATTNRFSGISISWTPATTSVTEINDNPLFSVFPTRVQSQLFVRGIAIKSVNISDVNGRLLLQTTEQSINVSHLPSAIYFATIYADQGVFVRRFMKE